MIPSSHQIAWDVVMLFSMVGALIFATGIVVTTIKGWRSPPKRKTGDDLV